MRVLYYYGQEIGHVLINRNFTTEDLLYSMGYDVTDQESCKQAYLDDFPPAYLDDDGCYRIDVENIVVVGVSNYVDQEVDND